MCLSSPFLKIYSKNEVMNLNLKEETAILCSLRKYLYLLRHQNDLSTMTDYWINNT